MAVVLNEAALHALLDSPTGEVGLYLLRRAERVEDSARANASGPVLGIQTGDLLAGLRSEIGTDDFGLRAVVGTDAIHRNLSYPAWHDQHGRPWLTQALAEEFA